MSAEIARSNFSQSKKSNPARKPILAGFLLRSALSRTAAGVIYLLKRLLVVHHRLEALQGQHADFLARGLRLEGHLLTGERVDTLASLGRRLLHDLQLHQARHCEQTVAAQALLDHSAE